MRVELQVHSTASRAQVWSTLVDWERQADWMLDARSVHVLTPQRTGVGVTIRCPTALLGVTVQDIMRVTRWVDQEVLEVIHLGSIIRGTGAFELADAPGGGTTIVWWERIDPPLGRFGSWATDTFVAPMTRWVFGRSLRELAATASRRAADGDDDSTMTG